MEKGGDRILMRKIYLIMIVVVVLAGCGVNSQNNSVINEDTSSDEISKIDGESPDKVGADGLDILGTPLTQSIWSTSHIGEYVTRVEFSQHAASIVPNSNDFQEVLVNFLTALESGDFNNPSVRYMLPNNSDDLSIALSDQSLTKLQSIFPLLYKEMSDNVTHSLNHNISRELKDYPLYIYTDDKFGYNILGTSSILLESANGEKHALVFAQSIVNAPLSEPFHLDRQRVYTRGEPEKNVVPYLMGFSLIKLGGEILE